MSWNTVVEGPIGLGESPLWDAQRDCLFWIDMVNSSLHCFYLKTAEHQRFPMPASLGSIVLCENGDILATMESKLLRLKQPDFEIEYLASCDFNDKEVIFNDGKCDAYGRFWVGSRDTLQSRFVSAFYLYLNVQGFQKKINNLIVSNGLGWSPDNKRLYLTDTIQKTIYRYPFTLETATVGMPEPFIKIPGEGHYPDGLAIDSEENIWVAIWGLGQVHCYQKNGQCIEKISLPAMNLTSCCFGDDDLRTLFVTSSSLDFHGKTELGEKAGAVFTIPTKIPGLAAHRFT